MRQLLYGVTHWCVSRAWLVVMLALFILAFALLVLVTRIAVVTDTDAMIDPILEYRQAYETYKGAYPSLGDSIVVVVTADTPEVRQRAVGSLSQRLTADTDHFQSVYAPSAMPFFQNNGLLLLSYNDLAGRMDTLVASQPLLGPILREPTLHGLLESLLEAKQDATNETDRARVDALLNDVIAAIKAVQNNQPAALSFQNAMLGEGARPFDILVVKPVLDPAKVQPAKAALRVLKAHIAAVQASMPAPVTLSLTGKIALNAEELKTVSSGAATAGLLSAVLVGLVLLFGVRSVRAVVAMLVNLLFGLACTGAAALLLFGSLNIISVAFAVLFIGLGIDFSIHILLRAREEGGSLKAALARASGTSGFALAICAPTTALAFLSFTPTGYAGLAQLGAIAAIGVFIALATSLTLLPALLTLFGMMQREHIERKSPAFSLPARLVLIITVIALLPALYGASQIGFEADPIALKDADAPSVQTYKRLAAREDSSPYALQLTATSADQAQQLAAKARALQDIGRVVWIDSFVPNEQADKLELIAETYDLLASDLIAFEALGAVDAGKTLTALRALATIRDGKAIDAFIASAESDPGLLGSLQSRIFETLPDLRQTLRLQLRTQGVTGDDIPAALKERYRGLDGSYRIEMFPAAIIDDEEALETFVANVREVFPGVTGSPIQIIESGKIVRTAMLQATGLAFGLVTIFLLMVLRSLKQVLFILVPVVLAGIFTLATASALGLAFNFANVIVLPLLLGLGVDAGIHYVKRAFEDGSEVQETGTTGRAVFLSAVTTIGSFGTLMVSGHDGTASMGLLLSIALCWLLVMTLIVLPALLNVAARPRA